MGSQGAAVKLVAEARRLISAVKGISNAGIRQEIGKALALLSKDERARLSQLAGALILQVREIDQK